jgi:hypothetical protein
MASCCCPQDLFNISQNAGGSPKGTLKPTGDCSATLMPSYEMVFNNSVDRITPLNVGSFDMKNGGLEMLLDQTVLKQRIFFT